MRSYFVSRFPFCEEPRYLTDSQGFSSISYEIASFDLLVSVIRTWAPFKNMVFFLHACICIWIDFMVEVSVIMWVLVLRCIGSVMIGLFLSVIIVATEIVNFHVEHGCAYEV